MKLWFKFIVCILICLITALLWLFQLTDSSKTNLPQPEKEKETKEVLPSNTTHNVQVTRQDGTIETMELDTYLEGVIGSEMPVNFETEALKAQCVAARTFVVQRDYSVDDTTSTQVYHDDEQLKQIWQDQYDTYKDKIKTVIQDTKDEIITYENEPISAVFYSSCHGYTNNASQYWSGGKPYLVSVESPWDSEQDPNFESEVSFHALELAQCLGIVSPIQNISEPIYYENGYVQEINIDSYVFTGRQIRESLGLRSSCFSISQNNGIFTFHVKGFGHGIGMSQYGAQGMALESYTYKEILMHYYPGTTLEKMQ